MPTRAPAKRLPEPRVHKEPANGPATAIRRLLTRKIWLPALLYEGLPYFYALAGALAIASTLFVSDWYWVLPYCWLMGLACLHGAIYVWRIRRHYRRAARRASQEPE